MGWSSTSASTVTAPSRLSMPWVDIQAIVRSRWQGSTMSKIFNSHLPHPRQARARCSLHPGTRIPFPSSFNTRICPLRTRATLIVSVSLAAHLKWKRHISGIVMMRQRKIFSNSSGRKIRRSHKFKRYPKTASARTPESAASASIRSSDESQGADNICNLSK